MNSFKIWIKAQLYNFILGMNICILLLILDLAKYAIKDNHITEIIINFCQLILAYGAISFLGGIPLILLFKATSYLSKKLNSNTLIKKIIEMIAYPMITYIYLIILLCMLQINLYEDVRFIEIVFIPSLATISTFISVIVHQHQDKKKRENEINTLTN
jgi:hypothetical protein